VTNAIAPLALGRLGDYYYQGHDLPGAARMYQAALDCSNVIDAATRSQAEIGLGLVARDRNDNEEALSHFDRVLYAADQRDPSWINQAGVGAAEICEKEGKWAAAVKIYQRVLAAAPALRPGLEQKIAAAQRMMDAQHN
jgi:tetratricopeptide (TPR) repeat protein